MSQGPLCPNLTKKFQKEVSQIANRNLPRAMLLGGLSVNLNHLKTTGLDWFYSRPIRTLCEGSPLLRSIHTKQFHYGHRNIDRRHLWSSKVPPVNVIVTVAGVSLALDRWPVATWFALRATYFWTLLAWIGHLSSESLFYKKHYKSVLL